ncbi:hypothetical protein [Paraburkholderia sp. DHOC27]|uniref:hypothetical protein n=1 Tax=Paraburkholderia sp. DHOC27 TaxID=2303330 RepID=UPI0011C11E4F|nr:hypothetical protein [Paraburkholderia sp. DHOC27]
MKAKHIHDHRGPHNEPQGRPGGGTRNIRSVRLHALAGIVIAPLAWVTQMGLTEALAAQSCFPHDHPLHAPALPRLAAAILAINVVCLMLGCLGGYLGWRNLLLLRRERKRQTGREESGELSWTVAYVGALSSTLFLFALVTTDIAVLIVSPCGRW